MASVTSSNLGVQFTLVLDEAEAQYVENALRNSFPEHLRHDTVWSALDEAMADAGVPTDSSASSAN